jgi:succinate dehydrogenase hydrophobic anchor subunit
MSESTGPTPRFLGRPDEAYPGYVPGPVPGPRRAGTGSRASRLWLIQALTGAALIVLLCVHLVAQHLLAPDGLRDYAAVVDYFRHPLALVAEIGLVIAVIVHACLGTRAALVDMIPGEVALRRASIAIGVVGVLATAYALWLTVTLVGAAA